MAKRGSTLVWMIPEDENRRSVSYHFVYPKTKSYTRKGAKLRMRKYHPGKRKHVWFVETRMPPYAKG